MHPQNGLWTWEPDITLRENISATHGLSKSVISGAYPTVYILSGTQQRESPIN
jgi:hypothetical protein